MKKKIFFNKVKKLFQYKKNINEETKLSDLQFDSLKLLELIAFNDSNFKNSLSVTEMYKSWYIDYASYVILERAIPRYEDGLKPVQRRILHSLNNMHDGRFHKVANIIGQSMQYHPHGDAAIGDALVNLGQ